MKDWTSLIQAVAGLLWALLAPAFIIFAWFYRAEIRGLIPRIRKLGKYLELDPQAEVARLETEAQKTQAEQARPPLLQASLTESFTQRLQQLESRIVDLETRDLLRAVAEVALELERSVRRVSAELGISNSPYASPWQLVQEIVELRLLPDSARSTLEDFWKVRNRLLHGNSLDFPEANARFVQVGLSLIRLIEAIPRYRVVDQIPVYRSPEAKEPAADVEGLVLEAIDDGSESRLMFPVTRRYRKGSLVAWEWNPSNIYEEMWYQPNGQPQRAWPQAAEFTGKELLELEEQLGLPGSKRQWKEPLALPAGKEPLGLPEGQGPSED